MSATLVLKCAVPAFALIGAGTVWIADGPVAAGFTVGAYLLGVLTSELFHVRWSQVDTAAASASAAASDSALIALLEAEASGRAAPLEAPPAPPPGPPKRNFRCTRPEIATGSARDRTELTERRRRLAVRAQRAAASTAAEPQGAPEPVAHEPAAPHSAPSDITTPEGAPVAGSNSGPPPPSVVIFRTPRPERMAS